VYARWDSTVESDESNLDCALIFPLKLGVSPVSSLNLAEVFSPHKSSETGHERYWEVHRGHWDLWQAA